MNAASEDAANQPARLKLTRASDIKIRPVHWLWDGRMALGALSLVAGQEGVGKSTVVYSIAAKVTRGMLPGRYVNQPRNVVICATEDSWEHTIVPRLKAAGADLERVFHIEVTISEEEGIVTELSFPRDIRDLKGVLQDNHIALIVLDPLTSRISSKLDTHKDSDVRQALEPLVRMADECRCALIGLIHLNKSQTSNNILNMVMASKAFTAVARSVSFVVPDSEDETGEAKVFGTPKNNLGRTDLPMLSFRIQQVRVEDTDEGPVYAGAVEWTGESTRTIHEHVENGHGGDDERSEVSECASWLHGFLLGTGGEAPRKDVIKASVAQGFSQATLKRAKKKVGVEHRDSDTFPRTTIWSLSVTKSQSAHSRPRVPGDEPTGEKNIHNTRSDSVGPSGLISTTDSDDLTEISTPSQGSSMSPLWTDCIPAGQDGAEAPVGSVGSYPPRARADSGTGPAIWIKCDVCHGPLEDLGEGHTTHPMCDPSSSPNGAAR